MVVRDSTYTSRHLRPRIPRGLILRTKGQATPQVLSGVPRGITGGWNTRLLRRQLAQRSVGAVTSEYRHRGGKKNLEVEPKGPSL
jgi:hypothetical protein